MAATLSPKAPWIRRFAPILFLIGLCWLSPSTAFAQSAPASAGDVQKLIKALDDPAARDQLKQQLELLLQAQQGKAGGAPAVIEEQGLGARLMASISHHVESVSNTLVNLVEAIADMPQRVQDAGRLLADPARRAYWTDVVIDFAGVLATAFIAAWGARRLFAGMRGRLAQLPPKRWIARLLFLPLIFLVEVVPTVAFALAAYIAFPLFEPSEDARLITSAIISAQLATMVTATISGALLAPRAPGLRLFRISDETAAYLQVWVRRLTVVAFYGYALTQLAAVIGVDPALREVVSRAWGLLLAGMSVIVVLQNRTALAQRIAGGPLADAATPPLSDEPLASPLPEPVEPGAQLPRFQAFRRQLARMWHILAIGYIAAFYLVWSFQIEGGFAFLFRATVLTAILFLVIRLADRFLRQVFDRSFALSDDLKRILPGLEHRANRYLPVLKKTVLAALYVAAFFALLQVWGLDVIGWLSEGTGRPVMAAIFKIVIIVALAAILSEFVNVAIEHYLRETDQYGRPIHHSGRMRTLLPLLRNAFRITLGVMVLMVVLSEIGVDIAPLLAAAGVVGLAIGFGAQTLVKDIITGVFILIEDTLSIGDVVDLGGHAGVVEGMTIRTIRLRDLGGTVHTVPFSAVTIVQNLTKDFSYALWDIKIDYRDDVDRVIGVIREVAEAIAKDKAFRHNILGPVEIIGVDGFQDNGYVVKARMKTRPMTQWDVMRGFNLALKRRFEADEIRFAGMMAQMPAARPVVHEVTLKDSIVAAALSKQIAESLSAQTSQPKAADAEAREAEGKPGGAKPPRGSPA